MANSHVIVPPVEPDCAREHSRTYIHTREERLQGAKKRTTIATSYEKSENSFISEILSNRSSRLVFAGASQENLEPFKKSRLGKRWLKSHARIRCATLLRPSVSRLSRHESSNWKRLDELQVSKSIAKVLMRAFGPISSSGR